jgi:chloramphenicol O-acetyltransferase type A
MKTITFTNAHRRKHFELFRRMEQPHFSITASVQIPRFLRYIRERQVSFTPAVVYCIARAANAIPAFKQRLRGETIVEHEQVDPSFTVLTDVSDVFSFCHVPYDPQFGSFVAAARARMDLMRVEPSLENEEGRDDYLFLSSFPWVSFTGFIHAMSYSPPDSVPRVVWGKYVEDDGRVTMPLSVQAFHALVDGRDVGRYFELVQHLFEHPEELERE